MSAFKFFHNDWLDVSGLFPKDPILSYKNLQSTVNFKINLSQDFFNDLEFDENSLKKYRIDAANRCVEALGKKPALCFSGGIDSQSMIQCFKEANIDIDIFTLEFKNGLNSHDVIDAKKYALEKNIKINFIQLDILNFLSRENFAYGEKYLSMSPHFNTHYKLCDILMNEGYTGFVFGGTPPLLTNDLYDWESNYSPNFLNYINYSKINNIMCQGNFLGFDPYLSWSIALLSREQEFYQSDIPWTNEERTMHEKIRYENKIQGYKKAGLDIMPQEKKYTGFELVKQYLEIKHKDGWAFEKLYRYPLETRMGSTRVVKFFFDMDAKTVDLIKSINLNNL